MINLTSLFTLNVLKVTRHYFQNKTKNHRENQIGTSKVFYLKVRLLHITWEKPKGKVNHNCHRNIKKNQINPQFLHIISANGVQSSEFTLDYKGQIKLTPLLHKHCHDLHMHHKTVWDCCALLKLSISSLPFSHLQWLLQWSSSSKQTATNIRKNISEKIETVSIKS